MKLTGWYRPDQKPVRVGWYECRYGDALFMSFWTGKKWGYWDGWMWLWSGLSLPEWRGIAK